LKNAVADNVSSFQPLSTNGKEDKTPT